MGSGQRKSAEKALESQGGIVEKTADLSRQMAEQSAPWRTIAGKYYTDILKGGDSLTKAVSPQINATTVQYQNLLKRAKEMPLGGSRDRALRSIRMGEAGTKAGIYSGGVQDAIMKLAGMGSEGLNAALGGYGSAGAGFSNISQSYSDMAQGKGAALGSLAGGAGGITASAITA